MSGNPLWMIFPLTILAVPLYIVLRGRRIANRSLAELCEKGFTPSCTFNFSEIIISLDIAHDKLAFVSMPIQIVPRSGGVPFMARITETVLLSAIESITFRSAGSSIISVSFHFTEPLQNRLNGEKTLTFTTRIQLTPDVESLIEAWRSAVMPNQKSS